MEQKKTLWIVAAAGIFLLVVVGAALILYSPSLQKSSVKQANFDSTIGWIETDNDADDENANLPSAEDAALASAVGTDGTDASSENVASGDKKSESLALNPFENSLKADHITVLSDNTTVFSTDTKAVDLNALKSSNVSAKNEYTESQINNNSKLTESYYTPAPKSSKKVAEAPKPAAKPKVAETPKAATKTVAKADTSKEKYWVQAAAYSSKKNADEARTVLESNKIPTEVFTVDSNGTTMYRVRVGPYTTKTEAEYWQREIAKIDKFADIKSMIYNTKVN